VVQYVGAVRDKTTGPALIASRMAVYFLAIGLVSAVLAVLLLLLLVRVLVNATGALPFVDQNETWLAYLLLGVVFLVLGGLLWRMKER